MTLARRGTNPHTHRAAVPYPSVQVIILRCQSQLIQTQGPRANPCPNSRTREQYTIIISLWLFSLTYYFRTIILSYSPSAMFRAMLSTRPRNVTSWVMEYEPLIGASKSKESGRFWGQLGHWSDIGPSLWSRHDMNKSTDFLVLCTF